MSSTRRADVLIEGQTILEVGADLAAEFPTAQRLDATACLVMPGLTNAHTHSPENFAAGFCDALHLEDWLGAVWGRLDHLSGEEIRLAVLSGAVQMLRCGVTAVVDHFRQTPMSMRALDSVWATYEDLGMRAMVAMMSRDRVAADGRLIGAPTGGQPLPPEATFELWTEFAARHRPQARVVAALGPSGATRCSDKMLCLAADLAHRHGLFLHTHAAETHSEADMAVDLFGCRTIRHLHELGFLGARTSLAHCVWIDDEEIELLAQSGAVVAHNPISNMALGSGIAPVRCMLDRGARVALGTDGAASNGAQNLFETIKCAALLARCGSADAGRWLSAGEALALAIDGGRRIFALGPSVIAAGAVADIAVFRTPDTSLDEFYDPVRHVVYGNRTLARHVLVDGDPLIVEEQLLRIDVPALDKELSRFRNRFSRLDRQHARS